MKHQSNFVFKLILCLAIYLNANAAYCIQIGDPECDICFNNYQTCKAGCGPLTYNSFGMADGSCILNCFQLLRVCVYGDCVPGGISQGTPTWVGSADNLRVPLNIIPGGTVPISVGLYNSNSSTWGGAGAVTGVQFYIISIDEFNSPGVLADKDWDNLGLGSFSTASNYWTVSYTKPVGSITCANGYVLAARFITPEAVSGQYIMFGATPPPQISVPTLSEWGLIILGLCVTVAGVFYIKRG